jgi:2,3,4,5-tetrahydropyridine-2-carboxylate N-succinyltransferase
MSQVFAFAIGHSRCSAQGDPLDYFFPAPVMRPDTALGDLIQARFDSGVSQASPQTVAAFCTDVADALGSEHRAAGAAALVEADRPLDIVWLAADEAIQSTADAYLKLHLMSHRLALPNTLNLDGIFANLPNVVWTSNGPIDPAEFTDAQVRARLQGQNLEVTMVDKFPRMTNYVIPSGVRIADSSRVRLGAYIGEGTTVMHEGQINFNAAALGPNMVEGRISQGVILGEHSDLGGSASTMGTLAGGGQIKITIGSHCLVGANAGTGIPLGDRCTIEAGLYITAGTPVCVLDEKGEVVKSAKARELAGQSDMLFVRNAISGRVECRTNRKAIELNEQLHAHN